MRPREPGRSQAHGAVRYFAVARVRGSGRVPAPDGRTLVLRPPSRFHPLGRKTRAQCAGHPPAVELREPTDNDHSEQACAPGRLRRALEVEPAAGAPRSSLTVRQLRCLMTAANTCLNVAI